MEQQPEYLRPLSLYLRARELHREGETGEAAKALERAFGSEEANPFLRQNLDIALDESRPAGSVVLDGIYGEMKWIQRQIATPRKSRG
jgi:hypothetical protein